METTEVFDPEEVGLLLIGADEELDRGLDKIDRSMGPPVCGWLRKKFWGLLSPEDLKDIWQDTLIAIFTAVKAGEFDPDGKLEPYVWTIAKNRAISRVRRLGTEKEAHDDIARGLRNARLGEWAARLTPAERSEFNRLISEAVRSLPDKQRLTLAIWAFNLPASKDMKTLIALVSEATGEPETRASVVGALREARKRVRPFLMERGYEG